MKFSDKLAHCEQLNQSQLCVGLDPDISRLPLHLQDRLEGLFHFCASIVDATHDVVMAYKPQIAYFSALGAEKILERIVAHIRDVAPHVPIILDAKRGDIGATATQYAKEAFDRYDADAVTLSPFMGFDSIEPYLRYADRGVFLLCRTSNPGGDDFQQRTLGDVPGSPKLYEYIAHLASTTWHSHGQIDQVGQIGLVVGATYSQEIARVRELAPSLPLLIPGVGAQGGDAVATMQAGWRGSVHETTGLVCVNSSRAILYASQESNFADAARQVALETRRVLWDSRPHHPIT